MTTLFIIFSIMIPVLYVLAVIHQRREYLFQKAIQNGPFPYVYVEKDGSVRELYEDEKEYLLEGFSPMDSGRPYIKYSYRQLTPGKKIHGFLRRRDVPRKITVKPINPGDTSER